MVDLQKSLAVYLVYSLYYTIDNVSSFHIAVHSASIYHAEVAVYNGHKRVHDLQIKSKKVRSFA